MKKITLLSAAVMVAAAAQAQNVDPSTSVVVAEKPVYVDYVVLSDAAVSDLETAGAKVTYVGPDENEDRHLYVWDATFVGGDSSMPRVDMEEGEYISFVVSNIGWSGAGFYIGTGMDLSHFDDNTYFHIAYMTPTANGPSALALIILDGDDGVTSPAKVSLGEAFNDGGNVYPAVAAKLTDDWQGLDITFADLKKYYPSFSYSADGLKSWKGNILSFLGGSVTGQSLAFDAIYFWSNTENESGVAAVEADVEFVVTANTVNVAGGKGIELYNLAGALVKSTNGTTLGLNGLSTGVYVAKSGNSVRKVVVK